MSIVSRSSNKLFGRPFTLLCEAVHVSAVDLEPSEVFREASVGCCLVALVGRPDFPAGLKTQAVLSRRHRSQGLRPPVHRNFLPWHRSQAWRTVEEDT